MSTLNITHLSWLVLLSLWLPVSAREYDFRNYNTNSGLSQNTVHHILQDRQGLMWFATKDGLNRFDGQVFRRIDVAEGEPCSFITTLYEDSRGDIWVSANNGPCRYSLETECLERFAAITPAGKSISGEVNDFIETPDGSLLMATNTDGVYAYDLKDGSFSMVCNYGKMKTTQFNRMHQTPNGRIYLGTFGDGLYFTDDRFKHISPVLDPDGQKYFHGSVIYALRQKGDLLYVATDNGGLQALDMRTGNLTSLGIQDKAGRVPFVRDINFYGTSEMWIATESGIFIYDLTKEKTVRHLTHNFNNPYSLSDDAVYAIYTDRDGSLWIGSFFGGIDYLSGSNFQFENLFRTGLEGGLSAERIRELCEDGNGYLYVGTEDNGLWRMDMASNKFEAVEGINAKNIHGICIDGDQLWVGTFSQGLKIKDLKNGSVRTLRASMPENMSRGLISDYIFSICRTVHGDIFLGTLSGMQEYRREEDRFVNIPELNGKFIYNIVEDTQGRIWAATYTEGLFRRDAGGTNWINYKADPKNPDGIPSDRVYSVQEDKKGNIWIMTQAGACVYIEGAFSRDYMNIRKIPGMIYRMEQDDLGRYWLTSNHGIYSIDPKFDEICNFTTQDGLLTTQFNYNSSLKGQDGKLYFGHINGLVCFNPLKYTSKTTFTYTPLITELYVNGQLVTPSDADSPLSKSITMTESLRLNSDENSIAFRFAYPEFSNSRGQQVRYRLVGYDKEWKSSSLDNALIAYSNLKYGSYRLEAVLCNDGNTAEGPMLSMDIDIAAPFYMTPWAFMLYLVIAAAIGYLSFVYYKRYTNLKNQRYIEKYTREKERETFDSKISFFTNVAHEIRTPLTLIKAPLDSIFKSKEIKSNSEVKENLDIINLNVDRLLILANQLLDFRKIESGNFKIKKAECDVSLLFRQLISRFNPTIESLNKQLDVSLPDIPVKASVDPEALTKILSNLFSNAIKYSSSRISIRMEADDEGFKVIFANDGKIVEPEKREEIFQLFSRLETQQQGTGIGLAYARSLAQMHGGTLMMGESIEENVFILTIPTGQPEPVPQEKLAEDDIEQIIKQSGESLTILLVEDNLEMRGFIEKKFISHRYRVFTATNGIEALNVLRDHYIDIIVTDVMMPEMDGFELLKSVKNDVKYSHIPVILLTAKNQMEDKLSGLEAGADAYIEKPFSVEYLMATIGSLLRNRERMRRSLENLPLSKEPTNGLTKVDEEFLQKVNDIIKSNFDNPKFSIDDVISSLGMSRTTFYRKIKGMLDLNPNDYIRILRLKRAVQLFREGHTSVSEVSYMVGFSTPGYFTKCFQKQFGMSPKEFLADKENLQNG